MKIATFLASKIVFSPLVNGVVEVKGVTAVYSCKEKLDQDTFDFLWIPLHAFLFIKVLLLDP